MTSEDDHSSIRQHSSKSKHMPRASRTPQNKKYDASRNRKFRASTSLCASLALIVSRQLKSSWAANSSFTWLINYFHQLLFDNCSFTNILGRNRTINTLTYVSIKLIRHQEIKLAKIVESSTPNSSFSAVWKRSLTTKLSFPTFFKVHPIVLLQFPDFVN